MEFISEDLFTPKADKDEYVMMPKVNHWNPQSGFTDASALFPPYYEKTVIPEFRNKAAIGNPHVRSAYLQAIEHIERNILKKTTIPAAGGGYGTRPQQFFPSK